MQGVDPGEVSERAFLKSHLSELVIPSQNPVFNSRAETQNPAHFHPSKAATSPLPGDSRHPDRAVALDGQGTCMRRKGMDGNAKEIQIIFHNPECIQNKSISRETELLDHMAIKKKKKAKKAVKLSYSVSLRGTYTDLHLISSFYVHLLDAVGKKNAPIFTEIKRVLQISISC